MALVVHTPGEPAGVGPELLILLAQQAASCARVAICDEALLTDRARRLGLPLRMHPYDPGQLDPLPAGEIYLAHEALQTLPAPGRPDAGNAASLLRCLDRGAELCLARGAALVTGPLHKATINAAGIAFSGHTEYLAERAGVRPLMLLANTSMRVALVTTHMPLREVPAMITSERVLDCIRRLDAGLRSRFGLAGPRIAVCGLNPHAGEDGHLGREDDEQIRPAIEAAVAEGIAASGPLPADTAFTRRQLSHCDAVLAMYHDQGLPPIKHAGFGDTVNVTLGLPYLRTSVDHGTAFDLAGRGEASPDSLRAAEALALELRAR